MDITALIVGPIETNCYLVQDHDVLIVIDPGDDLARILAEIDGHPVNEIVVTHRHWDHTGALAGLVAETGAPTSAFVLDADAVSDCSAEGNGVASALDRGLVAAPRPSVGIDRRLNEGDIISVGEAKLRVIHTPGHTVGSMCLYCPEEKVLFSGDTLFANGSYGRSDLPTGSFDEIVETMGTKFVDIPDDVVVLPGHGPASDIGHERAANSRLR